MKGSEHMANINKNHIMRIDMGNATLNGGGFSFYITDKNTSNLFVELVVNTSNNPLIGKFVAIEQASDYMVTLVMIKPDKEILYIDGELLEEERLFHFNFSREELNQIGAFKCEFRIKCLVNGVEEVRTTAPFGFDVLPSIVTDLDGEAVKVEVFPIYEELLERLNNLEEGLLVGYATKEYVDEAIGNVAVLDDETTSEISTWSSNKISEELKNITVTKTSQLTDDVGFAKQSEVDGLSEEIDDKVDKTGITLGEHTDGLIYVFINGIPTGNGVEMGTTGDIVGIVDSDNNIVLTGELADGTYTIVYESADGEQTAIGGFTLGQVLELFVPATCVLNARLSSSGAESSQNGTFVTDYIDIGDLEPSGTRTILFSGFQIQMGRSGTPYTGIEVYDSSKSRLGKDDTEYNDPIEYDESGTKTFKATVNNPSTSKTARYIRVYGHLGEEYLIQGTTALTSTDQLANCSLILG